MYYRFFQQSRTLFKQQWTTFIYHAWNIEVKMILMLENISIIKSQNFFRYAQFLLSLALETLQCELDMCDEVDGLVVLEIIIQKLTLFAQSFLLYACLRVGLVIFYTNSCFSLVFCVSIFIEEFCTVYICNFKTLGWSYVF